MKTKRTGDITPDQVIAARGDRTKKAMAELLGVSVRQYQKYENGQVAILPRHLEAMTHPQ